MKNKMIIPDKIHVGYQERRNTYTGKLAYIIYTDAKGVKRKENSWESWRSKYIEPQDFKNEPLEGFVLNKGVGGVRESYGWNARSEYIRVYDPRGFEFEITVANLLYILQETSSIKGKGLEGEFVYAWHGKDLILLPVHSQEYKECQSFTNLQSMKLSAKDMLVGHEYLNKKSERLVYLGKGFYYEHAPYSAKELQRVENTHIYASISDNGDIKGFIGKGGYTHLAKKVSDFEYEGCQDILTELAKTNHFKKPIEFVFDDTNGVGTFKYHGNERIKGEWVTGWHDAERFSGFEQVSNTVYRKASEGKISTHYKQTLSLNLKTGVKITKEEDFVKNNWSYRYRPHLGQLFLLLEDGTKLQF